MADKRVACSRAPQGHGLRKLVIWILKRFWFPILILILAQLGKKYAWASEVHSKLKKFA